MRDNVIDLLNYYCESPVTSDNLRMDHMSKQGGSCLKWYNESLRGNQEKSTVQSEGTVSTHLVWCASSPPPSTSPECPLGKTPAPRTHPEHRVNSASWTARIEHTYYHTQAVLLWKALNPYVTIWKQASSAAQQCFISIWLLPVSTSHMEMACIRSPGHTKEDMSWWKCSDPGVELKIVITLYYLIYLLIIVCCLFVLRQVLSM